MDLPFHDPHCHWNFLDDETPQGARFQLIYIQILFFLLLVSLL